ncbi:MAG: glycosyltransferase family 25 protein [Janthinobacterium lividum]
MKNKIYHIKKYFFILFIIISCLLIFCKFGSNEISLFYITYQLKNNPISEKDIKIFVINLDHSTNRYNNINKQFIDINLSYERFSAVDGYALPITNQKGEKFTGLDVKNNSSLLSLDNNYTIFCPSENINYYANSKILNRTLTAGEFGCYCSHREIWPKMVEENIPYALILEDDAILEENFYQKFSTIIKSLPSDWDLAYLFLMHLPKQKFYKIYNNPYLKKTNTQRYFYTSTGYLINLKAATKLLKYSKSFSEPIDDSIAQEVADSRIQAYITTPFLITTDFKNSTIIEMGRPD